MLHYRTKEEQGQAILAVWDTQADRVGYQAKKSIACCVALASSGAIYKASRSRNRLASLSWMQPLGQERIGVNVLRRFECDPIVVHELLQPPVIERIEGFGAPADVLIGDEDLRDGRRFGARLEHIADLPAPIVLLIGGRIEVHGPIGNLERLEERAHRPAQLTP